MSACSDTENGTLRVLVDQSGYDLLNLGDVAMLQSCVRRLRALLPDAAIGVFCHDPVLLATFCPGVIPIPVTRRASPAAGRLRRLTLAAAQLWKLVGPYTIRRPRRRGPMASTPRGWREAVRWADVVVASGGGYLADTWWWHGGGVLAVIRAAQRVGKPTAMFGQGLGPLTHRLLRLQAGTVLPRLMVLSIRGGATGEPIARALGVPPDVFVVTGDDALEIVDWDASPVEADAVGVNVRIAAYTGVDDVAGDAVGKAVADLVADRGASVVVLPVSLFAGASDTAATMRLLRAHLPPEATESSEVTDPSGLARAVRRCRVVVTGSYHAAVFALASGVPVVGLSKSAYYDSKFADLAALFPGATWQVRLGDAGTARALAGALDVAWTAAPKIREETRARARQQASAGREAYERFVTRAGVSGG